MCFEIDSVLSRLKMLVALLVALGMMACENKTIELELVFPNEAARIATDELEVFVFAGDNSSSRSDVRCSERLGRLEQDKALGVEPYAETLRAPFEGQEITKFPAGNPVVFVVGYRKKKAEI